MIEKNVVNALLSVITIIDFLTPHSKRAISSKAKCIGKNSLTYIVSDISPSLRRQFPNATPGYRVGHTGIVSRMTSWGRRWSLCSLQPEVQSRRHVHWHHTLPHSFYGKMGGVLTILQPLLRFHLTR